jgi:hypothetical protein
MSLDTDLRACSPATLSAARAITHKAVQFVTKAARANLDAMSANGMDRLLPECSGRSDRLSLLSTGAISHGTEARERRGIAINQETGLLAGDMKTGIEAPTTSKSITKTDKMNLHQGNTRFRRRTYLCSNIIQRGDNF